MTVQSVMTGAKPRQNDLLLPRQQVVVIPRRYYVRHIVQELAHHTPFTARQICHINYQNSYLLMKKRMPYISKLTVLKKQCATPMIALTSSGFFLLLFFCLFVCFTLFVCLFACLLACLFACLYACFCCILTCRSSAAESN